MLLGLGACAPASNNPLHAVWGSAQDDVWAAGNETIRRWNGSTWTDTSLPVETRAGDDWQALWGSSKSDVWAIGKLDSSTQVALHHDGSAWQRASLPTSADVNALWGSGSADLWAVGDEGAILHWDGHAWSSSSSGTTQTLRGVWGSGSADVWAVGDDSTILHYDGRAWSASTLGSSVSLSAVGGTGPADVWAVGSRSIFHYDGRGWSEENSSVEVRSLNSVWSASPTDVFFVGLDLQILHSDGTHFVEMSRDAGYIDGGPQFNLASVWGSGPNDVWAVGSERYTVGEGAVVMHYDGQRWSR